MAYLSQSNTARRGFLMAALQLSALPVIVASAQPRTWAADNAKSAAAVANTAQAKALLASTVSKIGAAKTIKFTSVVTLTGIGASHTSPITVEVIKQQPEQFSYRLLDSGKEIGKIISSLNGGYVYDPVGNRYSNIEKGELMTGLTVMPPDKRLGIAVLSHLLMGSHPFSDQMFIGGTSPSKVSSYSGQLNGQPINHIIEVYPDGKGATTIHTYVNQQTGLPDRFSVDTKSVGQHITLQIDFSGFQLGDTPLPDTTFSMTPPATATVYTPPKDQESAEPPILPTGTVAPNFAVQDVKGKTAHLADFAGKVVVLDFWSTWCGPCQASLPATDKLAKKYKSKDVVFMPVCSWDDKSAFTPWVKQRKSWTMTFYFDPAGRGAKNIASELYKVSGIPTQFVIGKDGKVAVGFVGYDGAEGEKNLSAAIDKALAGS
ncbi:hypothetical protein CCAX7_44130 [Capsulimonas corticalis]|uniref:Uncharacterized protein n=1 Tax=Capsulimonas corticalis TaxID=2219043 RepID=A0A402CX80_9BACT|nr:TlpA disulfide reductase family protein [Capsulimonas corticalis]BDI32362.1 hypothetical protein CCAX7_44130 [Capsulimonas corticalis]